MEKHNPTQIVVNCVFIILAVATKIQIIDDNSRYVPLPKAADSPT